jgi:hypothetical protein
VDLRGRATSYPYWNIFKRLPLRRFIVSSKWYSRNLNSQLFDDPIDDIANLAQSFTRRVRVAPGRLLVFRGRIRIPATDVILHNRQCGLRFVQLGEEPVGLAGQ